MQHSETQLKLMEAAILLFSQNDATRLSVQQINDLAGVSNKSALYYHFKSKWGLLEAALSYVLTPYAKQSLEELNKISEDHIEPNSIVKAMYRPMVDILLQDNGLQYLKFFSRMISTGEEGRKMIAKELSPIAKKATQLLSQAFPEASKDAIDLKVLFTFNIILNVISDVGLEQYWATDIKDRKLISKYLIDYIEGGITFKIDSQY
ncbi:TetR/AcrR family transcriptional regulator [Acinetobacter sp. S40]|uniref:TetR/AcrR family transcriptional regulator n=1 Tax=unclassified Acinetobacter TaxID=196816 RepID=UPI00190AE072|nr:MULTISPECIES: TetR/AcrR family transcriptional regulator [unclassified Acinetobacter]MBJ9984584.1 TetR/AcrR family transcriptional regulator [Acinetobacter sp. S40]MBK0062301.1 TetR/AcrR family transcriptional regulator [Acinetobacter sp. S55]MBK0066105.1 TetR/AcrR family transcriptional regulator [Acinetobacter sp. S54]